MQLEDRTPILTLLSVGEQSTPGGADTFSGGPTAALTTNDPELLYDMSQPTGSPNAPFFGAQTAWTYGQTKAPLMYPGTSSKGSLMYASTTRRCKADVLRSWERPHITI